MYFLCAILGPVHHVKGDRQLTYIVKFPTCHLKRSGDEADMCLNRDNDSTNLDAICEIRDSTCRFKLRCNRINKRLNCQQGQHIYTDIWSAAISHVNGNDDWVTISLSKIKPILKFGQISKSPYVKFIM